MKSHPRIFYFKDSKEPRNPDKILSWLRNNKQSVYCFKKRGRMAMKTTTTQPQQYRLVMFCLSLLYNFVCLLTPTETDDNYILKFSIQNYKYFLYVSSIIMHIINYNYHINYLAIGCLFFFCFVVDFE